MPVRVTRCPLATGNAGFQYNKEHNERVPLRRYPR
jgi:hypothetical protein